MCTVAALGRPLCHFNSPAPNLIRKKQTRMAELDFWAFISALKELLGPDHAQRSAVYWLDESDRMTGRPPKTSPNTKVSTIPSSNCFALAPLF